MSSIIVSTPVMSSSAFPHQNQTVTVTLVTVSGIDKSPKGKLTGLAQILLKSHNTAWQEKFFEVVADGYDYALC